MGRPGETSIMLRTGIALVILSVATTAVARERVHRHAPRAHRTDRSVDVSSEARIRQVPERSGSPARPIPEGEAKNAVVRGPSAPVTCNGQNSQSPACYTATQQSRPVTR